MNCIASYYRKFSNRSLLQKLILSKCKPSVVHFQLILTYNNFLMINLLCQSS